MAKINKDVLKDTSALIYILFALFGMSSLLDTYAIATELPIMVNFLPEGWKLPSILTLIIAAAYIGPVIYTISNRLAPRKVKEWPVIIGILVNGLVCCILLGFFWDRTSYISGSVRSSIALFILAALLAIVDCTSSVLFWGYISYYKKQYVSALLIGENLGGFLTGSLGLIQGASGDAICVNRTETFTNETGNYTISRLVATYNEVRFSVRGFYLGIAVLFVVCLLSFLFIHCAPYSDRARLTQKSKYGLTDEKVVNGNIHDLSDNNDHLVNIRNGTSSAEASVEAETALSPSHLKSTNSSNTNVTVECSITDVTITHAAYLKTSHFRFMLFVVFWTYGLMCGIQIPLQTYSCLPYGNLAYSLQVRLQLVLSPCVCVFSLFVTSTSSVAISTYVLVGSLFSTHQIVLAILSPTPPLRDGAAGAALVVLTGVLAYLFFVYANVCAASLLHQRGGHTALLWYGFSMQTGILLCSVAMFVIINVYGLLESAPECPG